MKKQDIPLTLLAPTFLGDAHQSGVWRTPPFKALLREWWRIATAAPDYNHRRLREQEGELFGNVDMAAKQSKVRLALKHWNAGKPMSFADDPKVTHPEVKFPIGSQLYLGYGPITLDKATKKAALKANAALQANETNTLSLAWPDAETAIPHTLQLIDWFGTVGGRSRNGWGSLALELEALTKDHPHLVAVQRDLPACLKLDWPHAIGKDKSGPLIWESNETFADWKAAMIFLAKTKIGFRTQVLKFPNEPTPHKQPQERHVLAYPVTKHAVHGWGGNTRLANQLRFKLFHDAKQKLRARLYHTPHACPLPMNNLDQLAVWQRVHTWLDQQPGLQRLGDRP